LERRGRGAAGGAEARGRMPPSTLRQPPFREVLERKGMPPRRLRALLVFALGLLAASIRRDAVPLAFFPEAFPGQAQQL